MSFELTRPIRALLVDDEEPARSRLRQLLSEFRDLDVVGEAGDGDEALEKIELHRPDVVFLDIQMPGQSGMEVASNLPVPRPQLVFCTAFDQYALEAFEKHAVDYIMKPVSRRRLQGAVDRLRKNLQNGPPPEDIRSAQETQARLFPQQLPSMQNLEYAARCRPARGIGGDYYDFIPLAPGRLGLALGDVSGKGMAAALLMAGLQGNLHSRAYQHGEEVDGLITNMNRAMCRVTEVNRYATFVYGVWNDEARRLTYCNAGHNPPYLLRADKLIRLKAGGMVIGMFPEARYSRESLTLKTDDVLVFFTDGISEAPGMDGGDFGEERIGELMVANRGLSAVALCGVVFDEVTGFAGSGLNHDDATLIVARVQRGGE